MTAARDEVLARIRTANGAQQAQSVPRTYARSGSRAAGSAAVLDLFVERVEDYRARVRRVAHDELSTSLAQALGDAQRIVVPRGLDEAWVRACARDGREVVVDEQLSVVELDRADAVVTACRVAIAETGTIVLDGECDQGRRAVSLVPDHHVCVVRAEQVVESVPEALARLEATRPLTMISGPSATSDIELQRVEGVHGPRVLDVILLH